MMIRCWKKLHAEVGRGEQQWQIVLKEAGSPSQHNGFVEGKRELSDSRRGSRGRKLISSSAVGYNSRHVQAVAQLWGPRGGRSPVCCLLLNTAYRNRWRIATDPWAREM